MPQLEDYLVQIHTEMQTRGMPELDDDTVKELSRRMQHPNVMQGFQSGQLTAKTIVDEVQAALRATAEGGDIADRSGQHTQRLRGQLGMP